MKLRGESEVRRRAESRSGGSSGISAEVQSQKLAKIGVLGKLADLSSGSCRALGFEFRVLDFKLV